MGRSTTTTAEIRVSLSDCLLVDFKFSAKVTRVSQDLRHQYAMIVSEVSRVVGGRGEK